jgi:hypothetical protein
MDRFEKERIMGNLVFMEKRLILDDDFLELSIQRKILSRGMIIDMMKTDSPSLDYSMKLLRRSPKAFTQFIDISITTRQNYIVDLLLNTHASLEISDFYHEKDTVQG